MSEYNNLYKGLSKDFLMFATDNDLNVISSIRDRFRRDVYNIVEELSNIVDMISTIKMYDRYSSMDDINKKFINEVERALLLSGMENVLASPDILIQNFKILSHPSESSFVETGIFFEKYILTKEIFESINPPCKIDLNNLKDIYSIDLIIRFIHLEDMIISLKTRLSNLDSNLCLYDFKLNEKINGKI